MRNSEVCVDLFVCTCKCNDWEGKREVFSNVNGCLGKIKREREKSGVNGS